MTRDKINIYHFSDTHGHHESLVLPDLTDVHVVVFTGDESNHRVPIFNEKEFFDFINWYAEIPVKDKIFVAGNHSSWVFYNEKLARRELKERGITYLNKDFVMFHGLKFYGDPINPEYGDWCFMTNRSKINKHWELIPEDVDVLLTHSPPKGVLDLSENRLHQLEMCGCSALAKRINKLPNLKLHCFGHIHNSRGIVNTGIRIIKDVTFSNATAVTDREFDKGVTFNGNIIKI